MTRRPRKLLGRGNLESLVSLAHLEWQQEKELQPLRKVLVSVAPKMTKKNLVRMMRSLVKMVQGKQLMQQLGVELQA